MLKFFTLISFLCFYLSTSAQKAFYYQDNSVELNKYTYFYMVNSTIDAHELTDPFIDKRSLYINNMKFFILYNELSLKNLTLIDGESGSGTILWDLYEGSSFNEKTLTPSAYKRKKLKGNFLIIDALDGANSTLIWRGWIDLKKVKAPNTYSQYQKAICLILLNFRITPTIIE